MLATFTTTVVLIVGMMLLWLWVQHLWAHTFGFHGQTDVLALRRACSGCGCAGVCSKKGETRAGIAPARDGRRKAPEQIEYETDKQQ